MESPMELPDEGVLGDGFGDGDGEGVGEGFAAE